MIRRILRASAYALVLFILLSFPFGPLFPWSPWTPGYSKLVLARADVLYPSGTQLPDAFRRLDEDIAASEQFHHLKIGKRIKVILCGNWSDFHRFMPALRGNAVAAAALETGTVIYVTPKIAERSFDYREFLRHELSHATLHQNQSLVAAHRSVRAQWLYEGLAVSFGRQRSYVTANEFVAFTLARDLAPVIHPAMHRSSLPWDMRFNYQVWRYFLEYLIDTRGRDRFQQLLTAAMRDPRDSEKDVGSVYGMPLVDAIHEFQAAVRERRWSPPA